MFLIPLHCVPFARYRARSFRLGYEIYAHAKHITTNCTHSLPSSFHFISFHSVLFHSASCSPPAAFVVLACAVVRAAGCHAFCNPPLLANARPTAFNIPSHRSKKPRQPLLGHAGISLIVRNALLRSGYSAHTLSPLAVSLHYFPFALAARMTRQMASALLPHSTCFWMAAFVNSYQYVDVQV